MPAHTPNRALARARLEALAWQNTPDDARGTRLGRRCVLMRTGDGVTTVMLGSLTDNQLRKYIGPSALEEAGDMAKNGTQAKPQFELGDPVERIDEPGVTGRIGYVGSDQGAEYGGYQYKVDWDNGAPRHYVPGDKLRRVRGSGLSRNGKGIYHGSGAGEDDYVIHSKGSPYHSTGRAFYVDRVEKGGKHTTISKAKGDPTAAAARATILKDMREGATNPDVTAIWMQTPDGLEQIHLDLIENGRREEPDTQAARELSLYIENDYALVGAPNSQGKAIEKNLLQKVQNGSFDLDKSVLAWMYLMEAGAKKYAKEFAAERDWSKIFNKPTRELVAYEFAVTFHDEHIKQRSAGGITPVDVRILGKIASGETSRGGNVFTDAEYMRAEELASAGLINKAGDWKLTQAGRQALKSAR